MADLTNESVIHVKDNGVEYLQFRKLLEYKDILTHCFTLKPLDFGNNNNYEDGKELFNNNYKLICNELEIDYRNIVRPYQTHTNSVTNINNEEGIFINKLKDIDGLITNKKNKALSLTFADCTPIYLFDPNKIVIGNIHSGWQGTVKQIAKKAVEKMIEVYKCSPKDIICAIGPTIRSCHFEVESDVKEQFYERFGYIDNILTKVCPPKYYIDTVKINKVMLMELGIREENIIDSNICTVCNSNVIHSYRKNKEEAGRNTAIIMLK